MTLASILTRADRERWCTRWGCTTCGAHDFRAAVLDFLGQPTGLSSLAAADLLEAMRHLDPPVNSPAHEFLLRWVGQNLTEAAIQARLEGTELGRLYRGMLTARDAAAARRREYAYRHSAEFVAQERARKAAERAVRHEERLAAKRIRDALRRASGELPPAKAR